MDASIPTGLFDHCTKVTGFSGTFGSCNSLTGISSGLFDKNTLVTSFDSTFYACDNMLATIPAGLFDNNNSVTTFYNTFYYCPLLEGSVRTLWISHSGAIGTGCFGADTGLTNYADALSAGWGIKFNYN